MKITVAGLWHLGSVTAACLAGAGFDVIGYDVDETTIKNLKQGKPPVFEPGLAELTQAGMANKKLIFTIDPKDANDSDIVWITFDTPVDQDDRADIEFVNQRVQQLFPYLKENCVVLISSQLPIGSVKKLQELFAKQYSNKTVHFACSPENLRLGKAIEVFTKADRVIVGVESEAAKEKLTKLFAPFTQSIIWMSIASAEMTKHALNAFLATSVVFINELATLCERTGADAREVERGLKSETRIGPGAYLRPGGAFAGGTLARDVNYLIQIGEQTQLPTKLFSAVLDSNHAHKEWARRRLVDVLGNLQDKTITMLGLTYKAGTDTLRRSTAIETCQWLKEQGANIIAHDPSIKELPTELAEIIILQPTMQQALKNSDAALISTEWSEFNSLTADDLLTHLKQPVLFDASGFLAKNFSHDNRIRYFTVGKTA